MAEGGRKSTSVFSRRYDGRGVGLSYRRGRRRDISLVRRSEREEEGRHHLVREVDCRSRCRSTAMAVDLVAIAGDGKELGGVQAELPKIFG